MNQQTQSCDLCSDIFTSSINLSNWSSDSIIEMMSDLPSLVEIGDEENAKAERAEAREQKLQTMKTIKAHALIGRAVGETEAPIHEF